MRYIGALAVFFAVFLVWKSYCAYLDERRVYSLAFLRAITDYRDKMRCYLISPSEWARGFRDESLLGVGFLERVTAGETFISAYRAVADKLSLPSDVDEVLGDYFGRLGDGYLESELEILESAIGRLESMTRSISDDMPKRQKAVGALLGACAVGTVILII